MASVPRPTRVAKNVDALFSRNRATAASARAKSEEPHKLMRVVVLAAATVSIIVTMALGLLLVRSISSCTQRLIATMTRLAKHDLTVEIRVSGTFAMRASRGHR